MTGASQRAPDAVRTLPTLYAIADQGDLDRRGVSLRTFAGELAGAGVRLLQYRNKIGSPQAVLAGASTISEVFRGTASMLVMNDRADLAVLAGWTGVHVGQDDLPPSAVRRVFGRSSSFVGLSTHTEEQVRAAEREQPDYVAVGPVFATASKADAEPAEGLDGVRRARALTARPLVAIGGITLETAGSVLDAGADSVAVISGLFVPGRSVAEVARDFLVRMR